MKTLKRKMFALLMVCALTLGMSTVAFAAETPSAPVAEATENTAATDTLTLIAEDGTVYSVRATNGIYLDVYGDTSYIAGDAVFIPAGTYRLAYSVTTPGELNFFYDGYDQKICAISGSGERTVTFEFPVSQWYFWPNDLSTNYSYSFIVYK